MARSLPGSVLLVAPQAAPAVGGVERHVDELARGLARRGVAVELAVCDPTGRLPAVSREAGVVVRRFPTIHGDGVFFVSPALARWVWQEAGRFELVHGHSYHTPIALSAMLAAHRARRPFVLTPHYHGTGHSAVRRALHVPYRPLGRRLVRGAEAVIAVSVAEERHLQRDFGPGLATSVVPNGIDVAAIRAAQPFPAPDDRATVLVAGRLEPYKGVDRVVDAFAALRRTHRLVIIGDGPERDRLEAMVAERGLGWDVALLRALPRPDVLRWLRTADVLVSLSGHEAFGMVALEGAVAGAGIVASAIPAHVELAAMAPGGRITYVALDASASQIATAIATSSRRDLETAELRRVPTWPRVVEATLAVYARVLGEERRAIAAGAVGVAGVIGAAARKPRVRGARRAI